MEKFEKYYYMLLIIKMTDIVQRIVWKKHLTSGDAKLHSKNIVGKKLRMKETKTTFEFRVIPKTKFVGKLKKTT
jgi:hypothetical protein